MLGRRPRDVQHPHTAWPALRSEHHVVINEVVGAAAATRKLIIQSKHVVSHHETLRSRDARHRGTIITD
jgi:hypothetical protein